MPCLDEHSVWAESSRAFVTDSYEKTTFGGNLEHLRQKAWIEQMTSNSKTIIEATPHDGPITKFREDVKPGVIDVHIITPGWGSSGYYSEAVLSAACGKSVYPAGMHMHIDHPTREAEKQHPARTILGDSPIAAVFTEAAHYDPYGWDGPGAYTKAEILPEFRDKIKSLDGNIGVSHYVDGVREDGVAPDGKKGKIIKELISGPLNTVDFVTVPGAGGRYRTMFAEAKTLGDQRTIEDGKNMPEDKLTLAEIKAKYPGALDEYAKEIESASDLKAQKKLSEEQAATVKTLKEENDGLRKKIAEKASIDFVTEEVKKAKLPEVSGKVVIDHMSGKAKILEDGTIDVVAFGAEVKKAIEAKAAEVEAIRKESPAQVTNNGTSTQTEDNGDGLTEAFTESYVLMGYDKETAKNMAELASTGRR